MKRSPLVRRTPMRRSEGPTAGREPKPRADAAPSLAPRQCGWDRCGKVFTPQRPMQSVCSQRCATAQANARVAERKAKERAETKAHRDAVVRLAVLLDEAQRAFNAWVRARDARQPCISCGAQPPDSTQLHAGRDAGHYRSVGSSGHLRFHEDNVHAQCVHCNQWGAGRAVEYRLGLLKRIGPARVEALEASNAVHKWTREEVCTIRDTYRARLREMKKQQKE